ncbi:DeoR/GlpR family DNA-binding transcription regulator [Marinitenerispora sediminis]|uniref:DeoR family transcriptional regulator n=1 Tax=Marinitenerispora sediminis TaxID=1931232 RepID=A0A368T2I8_9ACTN|nr:DeoR/GlpR family DNA-binding transcription regulator [Marinitenerispora sediminis]RCV52118.1 DeoR family transcriptional regulator [Marinitenerispora sediminis]RCV55525.1 DeoR family transcriptional regulator [Marinitenerispora sediminis]RCV57829.1 DeoR family transcriptional regulator [Marinitenerispora sediminis]
MEDGKPAFAAERRERILELVRANGAMALRDIASQVRASEVTVRRDVRALEAEGLIDRRRGGAALPGRLGNEQSYAQKARQAAPEKLAIARAAARLVEDDDAIVLGAGSTTEALARELVNRQNLTVVTNSLLVAQVLAAAPGVDVVMTGGSLRGSILALVGSAAEQSLAGLRVHRAFVSGNGVTAERGLSTPNPAVASVDRALVACAQEVIVLADHTKVGVDTMVRTVPPEHIAHLITDNHADPEVLMTLEDMGTAVHVAVLEVDRGE